MVRREQGFVELRTGDYWRARRDLPGEGIFKGMVLLLESIRDVDRQAHTIILRPHPSLYDKQIKVPRGRKGGYTWKHLTEHRFLVKDFLAWFEPVSADEAAAIRAAEVSAIQQQINDLQNDLRQAQADPDVMARQLAAGLQKWDGEHAAPAADQSALAGAAITVRVGMTAADVNRMKVMIERQGHVAALQAQWIKERVERIAETVAALTPFYSEQAAAALSRTEDIGRKVEQMIKGVQSLDLYVGKHVDVKRIRSGESAPDGAPLTIKQAKLYMDEEFAVWADIGHDFDFSQESAFLKALARNPSLVDQIFPTVRSVVCMAVTRRRVDYGNAWLTSRLDERNKEVFLLVRDGDNLYKVWSPVESHLRANRLFPTRQEIDEIFLEKEWYEAEAVEIMFRDVRYTDKLEEHEAVALHYKRFLILLAGLDHRLNLFGRFYFEPQSMEFLSQRFQLQYMRFVHDDEQTGLRLPGERRPPFNAWRAERNRYLRSGSRVIVDWRKVMTSETAPAAVRVGPPPSYNDYFAYEPDARFSVAVVFREGSALMVRVPVSGYSYRGSGERRFSARVNLSLYLDKRGGHADGLLCLDAVRADDLDYYIGNRTERRQFLDYIRTFKAAARFLREEERRQAATRSALIAALEAGGIAEGDGAAGIVDQAVITWRAASRGAELPPPTSPAYTQLLNQMFELARQEQTIAQAARLAEARGLMPLRLVVSGKSSLKLYCAPKADERDDRLFAHVWVHQFTLKRGKRQMSIRSDRWALLPARSAAETTVYEWPEAAYWAGLTVPSGVSSLEDKRRLFALIDAIGPETLPAIFADEFSDQSLFDEWVRHWQQTRRQMNLRGKYVKVPSLRVPAGLLYWERGDRRAISLLALGYPDAGVALYAKAAAEAKAEMEAAYLSLYANKERVRERLVEQAATLRPCVYRMSTGTKLTRLHLSEEDAGDLIARLEAGQTLNGCLGTELKSDGGEKFDWHLAAPYRSPVADKEESAA